MEAERSPLLREVLETSVLESSNSSSGRIGSLPERPIGTGEPYRVYTKRWYILTVMALLNICNGMIWITFSSIANETAQYYDIGATKVNLLAVVFLIVCIPLGLVSIWLLDVWGLRSAIILTSWLNALSSGLRVASCQSLPSELLYPLLISGQVLGAIAQPFIMFAPTKVAALWFPASERALANTIVTVSNPLGIMIANFVSPAVVKDPHDIPLLLYIYSIPVGVALLMANFGVCSSVPPTPPTSSAAEPSQSFTHSLKKLLRSGSYWLLVLSFGISVAIFTVINTIVEQILCPLGYSNTFAGWCGALMIVVGLVGAGCSAVYVDKTRHFTEIAKCGTCLATICLIGFLIVARYPHMEAVLIILASLTGFFGFAANPICLELSVECTYPIAEASSGGLLILSGQIQSLVLILVMEAAARPFDPSQIPRQTCQTTGITGLMPEDYTIPNMVLCCMGALICVIFTAGFKCDYKRLKAEQCLAAEVIVSSCQSDGQRTGPVLGRAQRRQSSPGHWAESTGPEPGTGSRHGRSYGSTTHSPNRSRDGESLRTSGQWADSSTGSANSRSNIWLS